jgi:hypothetical protein
MFMLKFASNVDRLDVLVPIWWISISAEKFF